MNKNGFTLVEVLVVMIILGFLLMLIIPSIDKLIKDNDEKKYESYERMMEEYAAIYPNKALSTIKLSILDNLDEVKKKCIGYVKVIDRDKNDYKAYIKCGEKYTTTGYNNSLAG